MLTREIASVIYLILCFFDLSTHRTDIFYFIHHIAALAAVGLTQYLRITSASHVAVTRLFIPFFIPGIAFGDTSLDFCSLIYSLASGNGTMWVGALEIATMVHLIARGAQWSLVALYVLANYKEVFKVVGWRWGMGLLATTGFWGYVQWRRVRIVIELPIMLEQKLRRRVNPVNLVKLKKSPFKSATKG
jgi:hypothetical protein